MEQILDTIRSDRKFYCFVIYFSVAKAIFTTFIITPDTIHSSY